MQTKELQMTMMRAPASLFGRVTKIRESAVAKNAQ